MNNDSIEYFNNWKEIFRNKMYSNKIKFNLKFNNISNQ